jgi:hypothetical protein
MWSVAVSGQRLGKHVPAATDTNTKKMNGVFHVVGDEIL